MRLNWCRSLRGSHKKVRSGAKLGQEQRVLQQVVQQHRHFIIGQQAMQVAVLCVLRLLHSLVRWWLRRRLPLRLMRLLCALCLLGGHQVGRKRQRGSQPAGCSAADLAAESIAQLRGGWLLRAAGLLHAGGRQLWGWLSWRLWQQWYKLLCPLGPLQWPQAGLLLGSPAACRPNSSGAAAHAASRSHLLVSRRQRHWLLLLLLLLLGLGGILAVQRCTLQASLQLRQGSEGRHCSLLLVSVLPRMLLRQYQLLLARLRTPQW